MLLVGVMLWRSAVFGQRSWMYGSESEKPNRFKQYGPFLLQQLAACLIVADPLRHVLFDIGLWLVTLLIECFFIRIVKDHADCTRCHPVAGDELLRPWRRGTFTTTRCVIFNRPVVGIYLLTNIPAAIDMEER